MISQLYSVLENLKKHTGTLESEYYTYIQQETNHLTINQKTNSHKMILLDLPIVPGTLKKRADQEPDTSVSLTDVQSPGKVKLKRM